MTIRTAGPGVLQRACEAIAVRCLSGLRSGRITLRYPDGAERVFGDADTPLSAIITVHNYNFFVRTVLGGDVGFAEAYIEGWWETDNLTTLLTIFAEHYEAGSDDLPLLSAIGKIRNTLSHRLRPNSKRHSRKNVRAHYDLSNELFGLFLDRSMTYSCAQFERAEDTLEQAQERKLRTMIEKARITASDHVLEIGCGWGSFAIAAVRAAGCRVTGVTLSKEQHAFATARVKEAGLEDRIDLRICDYRDIEGTFDRIVSIEMLEAVGHRYLGTFFEACDRLLAPNGVAALQVITIPDQRYEAYRAGCDFIQRYIFPGGHCPSLTALTEAMTKHSRLVIEDLENFGTHYARTLREWQKRFDANRAGLGRLGFDHRFERIWHYYLAYCEAGFAARTLSTIQLVLTRPNNRTLPACPGYGT